MRSSPHVHKWSSALVATDAVWAVGWHTKFNKSGGGLLMVLFFDGPFHRFRKIKHAGAACPWWSSGQDLALSPPRPGFDSRSGKCLFRPTFYQREIKNGRKRYSENTDMNTKWLRARHCSLVGLIKCLSSKQATLRSNPRSAFWNMQKKKNLQVILHGFYISLGWPNQKQKSGECLSRGCWWQVPYLNRNACLPQLCEVLTFPTNAIVDSMRNEKVAPILGPITRKPNPHPSIYCQWDVIWTCFCSELRLHDPIEKKQTNNNSIAWKKVEENQELSCLSELTGHKGDIENHFFCIISDICKQP